MTQLPIPDPSALDAALTAPTTPAPAPKPKGDLDKLLDKPLAPIKFAADGAFAVEDMSQCYRLARHYIAAGMVPRGLEGRGPDETLGRVAVAIEFGQQFKWSPAQSLQSIMVVNGRPCVWGDGPIALVLRSGKLLDYTGTIEGTGDDRVATFRAVRMVLGDKTITREVKFGVADAKRAGLWGKTGPWTNYPERMMLYRARAFCLRDLFADVLAGIGIAEEMDEYAVNHQAEKTADLAAKVAAVTLTQA